MHGLRLAGGARMRLLRILHNLNNRLERWVTYRIHRACCLLEDHEWGPWSGFLAADGDVQSRTCRRQNCGCKQFRQLSDTRMTEDQIREAGQELAGATVMDVGRATQAIRRHVQPELYGDGEACAGGIVGCAGGSSCTSSHK